ncbi:MAG: GPW/gp25 family protein [Clostridiales Family XIII bacterium]|jgi:phage baseplate assembly protein W|nr:GPW/gp25 family protein [Clostridiales Family XIII bacterium]
MNTADNTKNFLGRGLSFPISVDRATGRTAMAEYEENIRQSVGIILSTRCGERLMRPDFGSGLHAFVFENDGVTNRTRIKRTAEDALALWEPRIADVSVGVDFPKGAEGGFLLNVSYTVRSTNNPYNMVFPYFLSESV